MSKPAKRAYVPPAEREDRFVAEYLIDLDASKALRRTGFAPAGANSVKVQASKMMARPRVAAKVAEAMAARSDRTEITQDTVLREIAILLRSDVRHFKVDEAGVLVLADGAPDEAWRAVSSVKYKTTTYGRGEDRSVEHAIEFRLWDKPAAVKMAGQHLAMFTEKHIVELPAGAGVLAVPVAPGAEQWAAGAVAQQAALVARPATVEAPASEP
jgi:phage terminase small subunit